MASLSSRYFGMVKMSVLSYSLLFTAGGLTRAAEIQPVLELKLAYLSGTHTLVPLYHYIWEVAVSQDLAAT